MKLGNYVINAETLKAGKTIVVKWLHRIMSLADGGQVPEDWRRAVIVPEHSKWKSENYQGISLLSMHPKQGLCKDTTQ